MKTMLVVSAELQDQCKTLHECALASSTAAARDLHNARDALSEAVGLIEERSRSAHMDSCNILVDASNTLAMQFQSYLTVHSKLLTRIEARSSELLKQEIAAQNNRRRIMQMPLWKRLWWALTAKSL
jgi:hypothetical protein